ncbi:S-adenosyl-L-methionine-dependent methyltransferase [Rhizodiscina lignyota]|uniref:S-adenosyl-L-methionine-dependent methyltransferase n=1 Tax=Rhizodiscina lignyota TaxID=1504668 RepID=A0A9P4M842_9PEZI|nr:S-adenosyl-L-methionine-dependent methyltransferase [Rhizodiscina lignyota]
MAELVKLAKELLRHAEQLESQLKEIQAPEPSLEAGGPAMYPDSVRYPEIYKSREAVADKSKRLLQLSAGPADTLRAIAGPERSKLAMCSVVDHFDIHNAVPQTGSISFSDLAKKINVQQGILERVMRFGFSFCLFKEEPVGHVKHSALSQAFSQLRGWLHWMARKDSALAFQAWPRAVEVYTDDPKPGVRCMPYNIGNEHNNAFFDALIAEPGAMDKFAEAMKCVSSASGGQDGTIYAQAYDWDALDEGPVVDLGGGKGHLSLAIAKAHPKLRFMVQDLPSNEEPFNQAIPEDMKSRIKYQVHDFFKPQPESVGAKVFFMKWVMHDWPDRDCSAILKNLVPEVERGAKILIIDKILPDPASKLTGYDDYALFADLLMWTVLNGCERNVEQFKALLKMTDERLRILSVNRPPGCELGFVEVGF